MTSMFKAIVSEAESTGAGYGFKPHIYIQGMGVALSRSPKKALRHARTLCRHDMNRSSQAQLGVRGIGFIPIGGSVQLFKDGLLIEDLD
jgi:hypothetical protein